MAIELANVPATDLVKEAYDSIGAALKMVDPADCQAMVTRMREAHTLLHLVVLNELRRQTAAQIAAE